MDDGVPCYGALEIVGLLLLLLVPPCGGRWEYDAGDLGSYLLGCGGSGPGERAWWLLVLSCRVSIYADLAPDNFQGTTSLR